MNQLLFGIVKAAIWLVSKLPFWLLYSLSTFFYWMIYYILGYRKKVVTQNIKMALPELSDAEVKAIRKKFFKHFCDFIFESVKSYSISREEVRKRFVYTNAAIFDSLYEQGKSVMLWCGHYASWEWCGILNEVIDHQGYAVYKPMGNKRYDGLVRYIRERFGAKIVSNRNIAKTLMQDSTINRNLHGIIKSFLRPDFKNVAIL